MRSFRQYLMEYETITGTYDLQSQIEGPSLIDARDFSNVILKGNLWLNDNSLTDLRGCPRECNQLIATRNKLTTLEGAPDKVNGFVNLSHNQLTSLEGIGRKYLKVINKTINISANPIKSHILGLCLVEKLQEVIMFGDPAAEEGLQMAIGFIGLFLVSNSNKELLDCKEAMMEAGLKDYAKL